MLVLKFKQNCWIEFSEFCFKHFVHFIVCYIATEQLFSTPTLNQVYVIAELTSSVFYIRYYATTAVHNEGLSCDTQAHNIYNTL